MAAEGKGPTRFALEVLEDATDAAAFRAAIGAGSGSGGTGDTPMLRKGGTTYAVYLVDTTDPNASSVRLHTGGGTKAIRLLT